MEDKSQARSFEGWDSTLECRHEDLRNVRLLRLLEQASGVRPFGT